MAEAEELCKKRKGTEVRIFSSKLEYGAKACRQGCPANPHPLDGRINEAPLDEVFSNEGVGTMISLERIPADPEDLSRRT